MNCNEKEGLLIGYLADTLERKERDRLEAHLSSCYRCQNRLTELKRVRNLLRQWKTVSPPPKLKSKVMDNLRVLTRIEQKTNKELKDISMDDVVEWLRKRVTSEQIRIYNVLTDFLGREKGEEVFDYYLEEQLKEQMSAPPREFKVISDALNLEVEVERQKGGIVKEIIYNCPYVSISHELKMKVSPCEAICLKMAKLREKFHPVKVELLKRLPNEEGLCIFLTTPIEPKPV
ncbi:MAG: hypothetical protein FJ243_02210 [Nitrospira sp.]|nr:hypothetical protein [Nitrospira sp.]